MSGQNMLPEGSGPNEKAILSARDVEVAYQFFLGREAESQIVVKDRIGISFETLASSFLSSTEYQFVVAGPLRRGRSLDIGKFVDPPQDDLINWAVDRLPLAQETGERLLSATTWSGVFKALAHDPNMRNLTKDGRAVRSYYFKTMTADAKALIKNLLSLLRPIAERMPGFRIVRQIGKSAIRAGASRAPAATGPQRPTGEETLDAIQAAAEGLYLLSAREISRLRDGRFSFTGRDPQIHFALDTTVAKAAVVEITFSVSGARRGAEGRLYIDYDAGFSEETAIVLTPRGRDEYSAFIISPRHVARLRWDPDVAQDDVKIIRVRARGLSRLELRGTEGVQNSPLNVSDVYDGLVRLGDAASNFPAWLIMSRLLTQMIGGHGAYAGQGDYQSWIAINELQGEAALKDQTARLAALKERPLISILVPTYNTPAQLLREMLESVLAQTYGEWQLCIADDASSQPHVREILEGYAATDPRINITFRDANGHISAASNTGLELAKGDWLAMLDHDDILTPDALLCVAEEINAHPDAVLIYSDEDKIDELGKRSSPFFKPDYAPIQLLAQNYLNHLTIHRTSRVRAVGGWRSEFDGSQDYDLNLRVLAGATDAQVRHIPKVLYHWRAVEGSTALASGEKNYAIQAAQKAVAAHLERIGQKAEVTHVPGFPFIRVRHAMPEPAPLVSVIIPTRDHADLLKVCVESLVRLTTYPNYEILIADNGSVERETFALFKSLLQDQRIRVIPHPGPFNYSAINNAAVAESRGELVCLLNNDIEVIAPDWMGEMASWAIQPQIGCVGAKLYYPDDTIQHAGVILGIGGVANHCHKHYPRESPGYFGRLAVHHDVSAVTAACLMVRRSVYDQVSGLDPVLQVAFNDVDFCLRVREAGYRNVFTPFAELYHHESVSRGVEDNPQKLARFHAEVKTMMDRWEEQLKLDPFYSPNLTQEREDYSLR